MLFSSITFLFYFLPIFFGLYFICPIKHRNIVLLFASLFFYAWGEPVYVFLMLGAIYFGYLGAQLMEKHQAHKNIILCVLIIMAVCIFGYFKYTNLIIDTITSLTGYAIQQPKIILPIGISFFTFQIIGYLIDVYRSSIKANNNFLSFACYVSMFPQLIAGPIVRYQDVEKELESRHSNQENIYLGIRRFIVGLSKKVLISNMLGELVILASSPLEQSVLMYWIVAVSFMLQIYFDFSGYSDMAIGLGKIMGFNFPENFNYPFISRSISEFWRRWHMTLGGWFREYVYIPLGGNRVPTKRFIFNIFVVWALTGLWHGAAYNFIIWGIYFAVILLIEKKYLMVYLNKYKMLSHIYVLLLTLISFVIFNANTVLDFIDTIKGMMFMNGVPLVSIESLYLFRSYFVVLLIAIIGSGPILKQTFYKLQKHKIIEVVEVVGLLVLVILVTSYLVDGSYNPFLYFRF